MNKKKISF